MKHEYWNDATKDTFRAVYADPYDGNIYEPFGSIEPALRFGWNQALAAEYPGESWEEVEADLERVWHENHSHHGEWAELKKHVRHAWEKARSDWQGLASKARAA